jgi:hypothetical protein
VTHIIEHSIFDDVYTEFAVEENTQLILFELTMSDNIKKTVMTHRAHVPKDK